MKSVVNLKSGDAEPCCRICIYSTEIPQMPDKCLCNKKGLVTPDFFCRKFSLNIMSKTGRRRHSLGKKYNAEDFSIKDE